MSIEPPAHEVSTPDPLDPSAAGGEVGTFPPPVGVWATSPAGQEVPARGSLRNKRNVRGLLLVLLGSLSLLGQGERCQVDARFISPSATLETFWTALAEGNAEGVWECFVEGRHDLPVPGMLWFLPPTDRVALAEFRSLPVTSGRVLVSYEVRFVRSGDRMEQSFRTGDELVRIRGEWRIARPIGQVNMPELLLPPRTVDS